VKKIAVIGTGRMGGAFATALAKRTSTNASSTDTVAFGSTVTFRRDDGRVQKYRIVGEDDADPKAGSISFLSPVARLPMGKAVGDVVGTSGQKLEIIAIS
jgi:transcription elongation GreA/GreB family factor